MKKRYVRYVFCFIVLTVFVSCSKNDNCLPGYFSVSPLLKKVRFSKGNLQYQASTGTWRFAENQYDIVGNRLRGNVYFEGIKSDNGKIGENYDGWIDLFGWGTSGYSGKYPFLFEDDDDLYAKFNDISDSQYDWGVYNVISGDDSHKWRTLSQIEWKYILEERENADNLKVFALVDKTLGLILLPDNYWDKKPPVVLKVNNNGTISNFLSLAQWTELEKYGAVFLPCACYREEKDVDCDENIGVYWTSTSISKSDLAHSLVLGGDIYSDEDTEWGYLFDSIPKSNGCSVRLVSDK